MKKKVTPSDVRAESIRLKKITSAQEAQLLKMCAASRLAYNFGLDYCKKQFEATGKSSVAEASRAFNAEKKVNENYAWMLELSQSPADRAFVDLKTAFDNFFRGLKKKQKVGFPKFKSRRGEKKCKLKGDCVKVSGKRLMLPKGFALQMYEESKFSSLGKLGSVGLKLKSGQWYVSLLWSAPFGTFPPFEETKSAAEVGVDVGAKDLAILSTGEKIPSIPGKAQFEKKKKRLQRQLSRKQGPKYKDGIKPSSRWIKAKKRLSKLEWRMRCKRDNYLHNVSHRLTKEFGLIAIEDLNIQGMTASAKGDAQNPGKNVKAKSGLNRSILHNCPGELKRQIIYKADRRKVIVEKIDRWYPSSKRCSNCGEIKRDLKLSDRVWQCAGCGQTHDRDINAAKNILAASQAGVRPVSAREGDVDL